MTVSYDIKYSQPREDKTDRDSEGDLEEEPTPLCKGKINL